MGPLAGLAMRDTVRAEWTKLRTSPGTIWLLLGMVALTME